MNNTELRTNCDDISLFLKVKERKQNARIRATVQQKPRAIRATVTVKQNTRTAQTVLNNRI